MANNLNIYDEQFEELRDKLFWTNDEDDLEAVGAVTDDWTKEEWEEYENNHITDEMVNKAFCGYSFTCDDFFCTAGQYDKYPDKG